MENPDDPLDHWGPKWDLKVAILPHEFSGPQISFLRKAIGAGAQAWGMVQISSEVAIRVPPDRISLKTGNFGYDDLLGYGERIVKDREGVWRFWS